MSWASKINSKYREFWPIQCLNNSITRLLTVFKNFGTIQEQLQITSSLRSVQTADIVDRLATVKTAKHWEKSAKLVESQMVSQKSAANRSPELLMLTCVIRSCNGGNIRNFGGTGEQDRLHATTNEYRWSKFWLRLRRLGRNCVAIISDRNSLREVEPINMQIQLGNIEPKALVDSGSVCTIINNSLANAVITNSKENYWTKPLEFQDFKTFSNELLKTIGVINTTVNCNDWIDNNVNVIVVEDGHSSIFGRDLFSQLGLSLTQSK